MAGQFGGKGGVSSFGTDFREKHGVQVVHEGPRLDSAWSYQAQFNALNAAAAANKEVDRTFQEHSVKDVTDNGREAAAKRLQAALEDALKALASSPKGGGTSSLEPVAGSPLNAQLAKIEVPEVEVRREVKLLVGHLRGLRASCTGEARDASALDVLKQLQALPISVDCLKSTKVAVELNEGCWRGSGVSAEVRGLASSLVHRWRAMFRAGAGGGAEGIQTSGVGHERRCRNLSMDLEESCYGQKQRTSGYAEVVEIVCRLVRHEPESARALLTGAKKSKELVEKAERHLMRERLAARHRPAEKRPRPA